MTKLQNRALCLFCFNNVGSVVVFFSQFLVCVLFGLFVGKEADEPGSYRPVSLLCPGIKVLKRLILPTLDEHLPVPDVQHGFRAQHSTLNLLGCKEHQNFQVEFSIRCTHRVHTNITPSFNCVYIYVHKSGKINPFH